MANTAAIHLMMQKRRAAALVEDHVENVSVGRSDSDGEITVRLDEDDSRVATITDGDSSTESPSPSPQTRLEYVTEGETRANRKAAQIKRLLFRRVR